MRTTNWIVRICLVLIGLGLCMGQEVTCTGPSPSPNPTPSPSPSPTPSPSPSPQNGGGTTAGSIIADHNAANNFDSIPASYLATAKSNYQIYYGHTSHGSQIVTGLDLIYAENTNYAYNAGAGSLSLQEEDWVDLGYDGDLAWVDITRNVLNAPGNNINVVVWSWCGGVSDNTEAGINTYLNAMNQLETDYPAVRFVYMTGHLDGTGTAGNLNVRNQQIHNYCQANNKILFDFADIESYDPGGTSYPDGSDACEWCTTWCAAHTCPSCTECAHSQCYNCYRKGQAFWWMMARIAGWNGS